MELRKANVQVVFPMSLKVLCHHLVYDKRCEDIIQNLKTEPKPAEELVERLLVNFFWSAKARVAILRTSFSHMGTESIAHGIAYFNVHLSGTRKELLKVIGEGEMVTISNQHAPQGELL